MRPAETVAKLPPWEHQARGFEFLRDRTKALLAMDMGTGKSAICVWAASQLATTLILCPKAVLDVWPKQFDLHTDAPVRVLALKKGTVKAKAKKVQETLVNHAIQWRMQHGTPLIVVMNHEVFWRSPMYETLMAHNWSMLVVDECHKAKAPGGKFSKKLATFANKNGVKYVAGLTGTPMPHSPMDIYAQGRFIDPKVFGTSFTRFRARYGVMGGFEGRQVIGYQNEEEFAERLAGMMYRVSADEVLDLPPFLDEYRYYDLSKTKSKNVETSERKLYDELKRDLISEFKGGTVTAANAMVKVLRLAQVCCGHVKDEDGNTIRIGYSKKKALKELLDDMHFNEPVVVFCRFKEDLQNVQRICYDTGRGYSELSGKRNELKEWQDGETSVIGVQIQAGGAGVDLTRARICVYYSVGYSLGDYEQSRARVHRPGQTRPVVYYHLVANDTIEPKLYEALQNKRDVIDFIMELT